MRTQNTLRAKRLSKGAFIVFGLAVFLLYFVVLLFHREWLDKRLILFITGMFLLLLLIYFWLTTKWFRSADAYAQHQFDLARNRYFDESPIPMWLFDPQTLQFLDVNEAAIDKYGFSRNEFLERTLLDIRPEEDRALLEEHLGKGLNTFESETGWRHQTKSGEELRVSIVGHETTYQGKPARLVAVYDHTEAFKATDRHKRQERFLQNILESLHDPVWVVDPQLYLMLGNSTLFEQLYLAFGRKVEVGEHVLFDEVPPEMRRMWKQHYEKALAGETVQFDFTADFGDGEHSIRASIYPISDRHGQVEYLVCSNTDVTQYLRLKLENEEALKRYELISRVTNDALWEWNPIENTVSWGAGMRNSFGYDVNETSLTWWSKRVHPDDRDRVAASLHGFVKADGHYWREQYRFATAEGSYKQVIDHGYALRDDAGKAYNVVGAILDIDELLHIQEEVTKLSLVASKATNGVIITDATERIEWVNEGFTKITGYGLKEVVGKRPSEFLQGDDTNRDTLDHVRKQLDKQENVSVELLNYTKDGRPFWVEMNITPVVEDGETVRFIAIESDITDRRTYMDLVERKNKTLQEVAVLTAHELRKSVANILGLGELMERSSDKGKMFNEIFPMVIQSSKEMDKDLKILVEHVHQAEVDAPASSVTRGRDVLSVSRQAPEGEERPPLSQ